MKTTEIIADLQTAATAATMTAEYAYAMADAMLAARDKK